MFEDRDSIDIACEFCGQPYSFDAVDALKLFSAVH
jgi:redox-regulated HSP33 family molecular chaperone